MRKYYEAYGDRYRIIHEKGYSWASDEATPIVLTTLEKHSAVHCEKILEIGCGEGRDAIAVLKRGYDLTATDVSKEAIEYAKKRFPEYADRFSVLDCVKGDTEGKFDFIYSVAVLHMLVDNEDRKAFYNFIKRHLNENGHALVCVMGDGKREFSTDISEAFALKKRDHRSGEVFVAATSLKTVSESAMKKEIEQAGLVLCEYGLTSSPPEFDKLMYVVLSL